jgi:hypothetical protein
MTNKTVRQQSKWIEYVTPNDFIHGRSNRLSCPGLVRFGIVNENSGN